MGPKPFVEIEFSTNKDYTYYVTLFSNKESGPWQKYNEEYNQNIEFEDENEKIAWEKFVNYSENNNDEFFYIQYQEKLQGDDTFVWKYMPPSNFKIVIYILDTDEIIYNDNIYQTYAFQSYYQAEIDFALGTIFNIEKNYNYGKEILALIIRLIITILVELAIALLFKFRGKALVIVSIINFVTQILLNIALYIICYYQGTWIFPLILYYIPLELLVIILEAILYYLLIHKDDYKGSLLLYTIIANVITTILTFIII